MWEALFPHAEAQDEGAPGPGEGGLQDLREGVQEASADEAHEGVPLGAGRVQVHAVREGVPVAEELSGAHERALGSEEELLLLSVPGDEQWEPGEASEPGAPGGVCRVQGQEVHGTADEEHEGGG